MPGIYILQGGGLTITQTSTLTGSGVMFYNAPGDYSGEINLSGKSNVTLSAMTSGPYQGIVFFQNRSSSDPVEIGSGDAMVTLTGVVYAPDAPVAMYGSGTTTIQGDAADGIPARSSPET